ncbi:MAG: Phosphoribosylaminoimidazole-succinocarboxamide synthase [uncultured Quadrisphaera sp.]|uniref:Phosphoribosylaminoimidazole-succinocarboxamide synthase n=1 Tax=uncultured Quadrisphaera sp. TaxID=904978 RepID=A0A6J4PCX9_9ACTN|nr:MAG: Phosphoribosylaminoimidazole-succinocarboxamide synthase [uncultured Quadrisphaera sp.]
MPSAPPPDDLPGWRLLRSGKVRDVHVDETDPERVLLVASDRVSAYDHVLATPVPDKGAILTALSLWWFARLEGWDLGVGHHVLDAEAVSAGGRVPDAVAGRAMVCRRLAMVPVECVARGWLTGSALTDYRATGAVAGVELPDGLGDGDRLGTPVFTPATKAEQGEHDENTTYAAVATVHGEELARRLREVTLGVYERAAALAAERGLVLADTKLELGHDADGVLRVGDELLTPDSSRFWAADGSSLDKQYVRDWLTSPASGWDRAGTAPPPPLPDDVVAAARARYVAAYERITGLTWG